MSTVLLLAGALTVAAFLRFYRLDELPPGLWHDEAFNGLDALRVLAGEFPLIFEANHGRQPLFIYLQAGAVALLGATPEALRAASALVGVLTVGSVYFLARDIEADAQRGRRAGLLAAGLLAVMPWHVHLSRYGLRAILFALLVSWFLFFLWRAFGSGRWPHSVATGVALAGAFYTYIAAVLLPPLLVLLAALRALACPASGGRLLRSCALVVATALLLLTPLILFYLQQPGLLLGRPADVSLFNPSRAEEGPLAAGVGNVVAVVGMFFRAGSTNWRHNVAGWPLLDPVSGALLLAGVAIAVVRWWRREHHLLLLAAATLLLPSVLSAEGLPHAKYALGMAPVAAVLMARGALGGLGGVTWLLARARARLEGPHPNALPQGEREPRPHPNPLPQGEREPRPHHDPPPRGQASSGPRAGRRPAVPVVVLAGTYLGLLAVTGGATYYRYFVVWAAAPEVYFAHESDVRAAAEVLRGTGAEVPGLRTIWAHVADPDQVVSLRFLAPQVGDKIVAVGHQNELGPVPEKLLPLLYLVPASQRFVPPDLDAILGTRPLLGPPTPLGEPAFRAYLLEGPVPAPAYSPATRLDARLGQAIELRGASVAAAPGDERGALVSLLWRPLADPGPEARLFFHLLDSAGRTRGQGHFSPRPQYPWDVERLPDAGLVSWFLVPLDAAAQPGDYRVAAGLSAALGGAALAADARGSSLVANRVVLGSIPFGPSPTPPTRSLAMEEAMKEVAPGLQLVGYRLAQRQALPGEAVDLALYWRALSPGLPDYRVAAWVASGHSNPELRALSPGGADFPTSAWRRGELVEDLRDLRLPARAPAGEAEIWLSVFPADAEPAGSPFSLARLTVAEQPRSFTPPPLACCLLSARLGGVAILEAVQLDRPTVDPGLWRARPGETLQVSLYWRAADESETAYKVFLHLVSEQGTVAAQHDSPPALGTRPTTGWVRDEIITDAHPLALPSNLAPERYRLVAGLYDEATGQRLPTGSSGDAVALGAIVVGGP